MLFLRPPVFSDRKFVGLGQWLVLFFVTALLGIGLSFLTGRVSDGRVITVPELLLTYPLIRLCFSLLFIGVLARFLRISFPAALQGVVPWLLPFQLLPGAIDLVLQALRIATPAPYFVNPSGIVLSLVSVGFAPHALLSYGSLITLACLVAWLFIQIKRARGRLVPALSGTILFYVLAVLFAASSSVLGWFGLVSRSAIFTAGSNVISRGLIVLSQEGYWWKNIAERFPGALGGEVEVSVLLLLTVVMYLVLVAGLVAWIYRIMHLSWRAWLFEDRRQLLIYGVVVLLSGGSLALVQGEVWLRHWTMTVAAIVLLITWLAALLSVLGDGDVTDMGEDDRAGRMRPLTMGTVSAATLEDLGWIFKGVALVGGWLLGWPICLCIFLFSLAQAAYRSPVLQAKQSFPFNHLLLGLSVTALWLSGWFLVTQDAVITHLPLHLALGMWLFFSAHSVLKGWIESQKGRSGLVTDLAATYGESRARYIAAGFIGGAYLFPGLSLGSWFLLAFGAAIGFATFLTLLSKKMRIYEIFVLFCLFLFVSVFTLGR